MTHRDTERAERLSREASGWYVSLEEHPDDQALRDRFAVWVAESDDHAEAWARTKRTAAILAQIDVRDLASRNERPRRQWLVRVGAGLAVAAVLLLALGPGIWRDLRADIATGVGDVSEVALADGSKLTLGASSAVTFERSSGGRHAVVLEGQAFFSVAKREGVPFDVTAGSLNVIVTGTAFSVDLLGASPAIAVQEGQVRVAHEASGSAVELAAGEIARLGSDGKIETGQIDVRHVGAWRQQRLVVIDRPFGEVIARLRPHYRGLIVLAAPSLGALPVTGVYDTSDPARALHALASAHGAQVLTISPFVMAVIPG
ncbi:MAG: FecR domain-containing protein [Pseudomonadota bacterium]